MKPDKNFKLALYNAGSLNTGHDDFLIAMDRFNADVVAINETWLSSGQEACAPAPPGYRLRNAPRPRAMKGGRGGGVAFYVKKNLRVRFERHPGTDTEQLWLSTRLNGHHVIIGTAYRPPWLSLDTFIDSLTESITSFGKFDYVVLMGDFNVNMIHNTSVDVMKVTQFLQCMDLRQVVDSPTHFSAKSQTLIDLVCTNCRVRDINISNITGSLGHAMINVSLVLKKTKTVPKTISYRPLKKIDIDEFNRGLDDLDWEAVSQLPSVDQMVDAFNSLLLSHLDRHAPVTVSKLRPDKSLPWVTDMIRYMMNLRNSAHETYKNTKLDVHKKYYQDLKNTVTGAIKNEKQAYFNHLVNSNTSNSKSFWKNIKNKILIDPSKNEIIPDAINDPDKINDHFLMIPGSDLVPISQLSYFTFHRFDASAPLFKLHPVSESEVTKYILSSKSNVAGIDGISRDMILLTLPRTLTLITSIINKSLVTGLVPYNWKSALVTPLPKVDQPSDIKDLRPISILPYLSKILERAVYEQVVKYVELNGILPSHQSGFRRGRGTVTALLDVTDNILADQDNGLATLLVLLDYSRAFDSINIPLLLAKLSYYGFEQSAIAWFDSYLSNRHQSVRVRQVDGQYLSSASRPISRGVPQGSILGPLLFIIYTADLPLVIRNSKYHCFADDLQLYLSVEPASPVRAVQAVNEDLNRIAEWSLNNSLVLNPSKSKLMVLGTKSQVARVMDAPLDIKILNTSIEIVTEARNLGVVFDSQLRFDKHVLNLARNCFYRLKVLYKIRELLSTKARVTLCESLVLSRLNYADLVYGPRILGKSRRLLQRIQNACCRFCFNIPSRGHVSPFVNKANMLNMDSRRRLHLASLMFDIMTFNNPKYLYEKLKPASFQNRYGSGVLRAARVPLAIHPHRTVGFTGSFRHQATKCWNDIPPPIRNAQSKFSFKTKIKSFLMEKQKRELNYGRFGVDCT